MVTLEQQKLGTEIRGHTDFETCMKGPIEALIYSVKKKSKKIKK